MRIELKKTELRRKIKGDWLRRIIDTVSTLLANHSGPRVTILHLKETVKKQDINRVIDTKGKDRNKVFRHCKHM